MLAGTARLSWIRCERTSRSRDARGWARLWQPFKRKATYAPRARHVWLRHRFVVELRRRVSRAGGRASRPGVRSRHDEIAGAWSDVPALGGFLRPVRHLPRDG